ncbi:class I SAM-dependent methyltransferase [Xinfangfangia sp. CPCC 101601]|uniref:Class I SAM-dependent methyltransferase n=1 Tax=Pseudogemmobacter lacusdianii TaxID=3069608 RepID=A0ABU0VXV3_9RHOB|nr:class I SAM-dependent methyltransferase [Xinfangfangia sp. CPCC 101601]MDQ2066589.1 class I SAM-dependent methyltransferase [Xinfangfangia sp. CPCC 101601]
MGVSLCPATFLMRHRHAAAGAQRGLILGRQKLHLNGRRLARFLAETERAGCPMTEADIVQPDGFTEALFTKLGYPTIEAMDFTDAEGAQHVHDLNHPAPAHLHEQFDIVIDGGTTEHIFHIGQALDSCHAMLKPGGLFLSYVSADGWFGHGFFQTGPDVPWRYWHHARGYEMLEVSLVYRKAPMRVIPVEDPTGKPRGGERALIGPHMLLTAARKPLTAKPYAPPIQGHYVRSDDA